MLCNINDEFQQNKILDFGKKTLKDFLNKRNESSKNESKNINTTNSNYNYKIFYKNYSIENKKNLKKISS